MLRRFECYNVYDGSSQLWRNILKFLYSNIIIMYLEEMAGFLIVLPMRAVRILILANSHTAEASAHSHVH